MPLKRSKTTWHRGMVRIRCVHCNHIMFRFRGWFRRSGRGDLKCPKCLTPTYALKPPKKFDTKWPEGY